MRLFDRFIPGQYMGFRLVRNSGLVDKAGECAGGTGCRSLFDPHQGIGGGVGGIKNHCKGSPIINRFPSSALKAVGRPIAANTNQGAICK